MIVRPGMRMFYAMPNEDLDGINIGEVGEEARYVDVPLGDVPGLIKRLRAVSRELKADVAEAGS
jgi:hypothetical protein